MKKSEVLRRVYWRRWCSRWLTGPLAFWCRSLNSAVANSAGDLATFVLALSLLPGFHLCWCRLDPRLRLPGLGRGLRHGLLPVGLGFLGGCPAGGSGFLGGSPAVRLLKGEAVYKYLSFKRVHAHHSAAAHWRPDRKEEYANYLADPDHLIAVTSSANRSKRLGRKPRFSPNRRFLNVDYGCNSCLLKRITDTTIPYKIGIRLLGIARNPANGFPARPLGPVAGLPVAQDLMGRTSVKAILSSTP